MGGASCVVFGALGVLENFLDDGADEVTALVAVPGLDDHPAFRVAVDHQITPEVVSDLVAVVHSERAPGLDPADELVECEVVGVCPQLFHEGEERAMCLLGLGGVGVVLVALGAFAEQIARPM